MNFNFTDQFLTFSFLNSIESPDGLKVSGRNVSAMHDTSHDLKGIFSFFKQETQLPTELIDLIMDYRSPTFNIIARNDRVKIVTNVKTFK